MENKTKILLVDDREENLIALEKLLSNLDVVLIKALSGNEALQHMLEHEFALVLMDVQMPEMDGFEVVQIMRDNKELENTPVIFISAIYKEEVYTIKGIESGAVDFIIKPIIPSILIGKVSIFIKLYKNRKRLEILNKEIKNNEKKILKSQAELIKAQEIAKLGNFYYDPIKKENDWSDETYKIFGISQNTEISLNFIKGLIHPDDLPLFNNTLNETLNGKKNDYTDYRIICPDGTRKWIRSIGEITYNEKGQFVKLSGTIQDITFQKETEEKLQQAEKMQVIGQLAGGIAHDFNNQLAIIIGNTEICLDKNINDPTVNKFLQNTLTVSKRAADLTAQLLAFSRRGNYAKDKIDINKIVIEVINMLERTIDKKIEVKRNLMAEKAIIEGDPTQIYSAILNIAINARDALPNGGGISFNTDIVNISDMSKYKNSEDAKPGTYVKLRISDNGIGIEPAIFDKIFEPFFTTKDQGKGTGMGLSAVLGIVKIHEGIIDISSTIGKGTSFTLLLPLYDGKNDEYRNDSSSNYLKNKYNGTVLIVDDEQMICELGKTMLEYLGFNILIANNGQKALEIYNKKKDQINFIILDIMMPVMDGKEALLRILKINPKAKVLISTGYTGEHLPEEIIKLGAFDILTKPFDRKVLAEKVANLMAFSKNN